MTDVQYMELEAVVTEAVITAIKKMGLPAFKASSLFASNEARSVLRQAA
jgi:hypothetical protein